MASEYSVSESEFRRDPKAAILLAKDVGQVRIVDDEGKAVALIGVPQDERPVDPVMTSAMVDDGVYCRAHGGRNDPGPGCGPCERHESPYMRTDPRPCNEPARKFGLVVELEGVEVTRFSAIGGTHLEALDKVIEQLQCRRGEIIDLVIARRP